MPSSTPPLKPMSQAHTASDADDCPQAPLPTSPTVPTTSRNDSNTSKNCNEEGEEEDGGDDEDKELAEKMRLYPQDFLPTRAAQPTFGFAWSKGVVSPFVTSKQATINAILDAVGGAFSPNCVVLDVGCGNGAFLLEAASRYGCRCVGLDIDKALCEEARAQSIARDVGHLVEVHEKDLFQIFTRTTTSSDKEKEKEDDDDDEDPVVQAVDQATIFFFYLLPSVLDKLEPWLLHKMETTPGLTLIFNTWAPTSEKLETRFLVPGDRAAHAKRGFFVFQS